MTSEPTLPRAAPKNRVRYILAATFAVLGVAGCLWVLTFALLWVSADEGAVPPKWRLPELPSGASVVAEDQECGSGGCNWKITVQPAAGQSPDDLAQSMGLIQELSLSPTLFDPASVFLRSEPSNGQLVIRLGYSGGFK